MDLGHLIESWRVHMRAERKSKATIDIYTRSVAAYQQWCADADRPADITLDGYRAFSAHLVETNAPATTIRTYQNGLRRFSAWMLEEGETDADPLEKSKLAQGDSAAVNPYSDDEMRALLATCKPPSGVARNSAGGKRAMLVCRRDEAILRLLSESMMRADELLSLTLDAVDIQRGVALVVRGKGGKGRFVPFGPQTARALDRYLRERRGHQLADETDRLWLGANGQSLVYVSLWAMIKRRAKQAGIRNAHPHRFRHTGATKWLAAGGSEGGLMAIAGWSKRDMLDRYVRATAAERAISESRSLDLGDL